MSQPEAELIVVTIPIRTVSEANSHQHWRHRQKRAKSQRVTAYACTRTDIIESRIPGDRALVVTLTRISPRPLDDDNLASSQKHVRDGVADALGIDDRDPRVTWRYAQRRGAKGQYAVEVTIKPTAPSAAAGPMTRPRAPDDP